MTRPHPRVCFRDESCPSPKHHDDYLGYNAGCRSAAAILAEDRYRRGLDPKSAPMVGVRRRLQALAVLGWPAEELGRRIDRTGNNVKQLRSNSRGRCRYSTWERVDQLYHELSDRDGPSLVTAQRARRSGWLAPIQWDDDVLDDPKGRPGHRARPQPVRLTGDRVADIAALDDADWTAEAIAVRLGVTERCVERARKKQRAQASSEEAA